MGPVLGSVLVFASTSGNPTKAALYLATYRLRPDASPHHRYRWWPPFALRLLDRAKRHLRVFELASGTLLAAMGILFITGNEAAMMGFSTKTADCTCHSHRYRAGSGSGYVQRRLISCSTGTRH